MRSRMMWLMALAILLTASCTKDNTVVVSDATVVDVSDDANVGDLSTDVLSGDTQLPDTTGCELRFRIDNLAIDQAKRTVTITAVAENLTGKPLEITFGDNCPAGSVQFSGAGDGYDYYGTCAAGACSPERPKTHTITIPSIAVEVSELEKPNKLLAALRPAKAPALPEQPQQSPYQPPLLSQLPRQR